MSLDRFYLPGPLDRQDLQLDGPEAHHLSHVLRKKVGDRIELFDGQGNAVVAAISAIEKRHLRLSPVEPPRLTPQSASRTILAVAVPKGDRFRWLVEKITELGVDELWPLITTRSVVEPGAGKLERMEQHVIAACKQCRRDRLLKIRDPLTWTQFLDAVAILNGQRAGDVSPPCQHDIAVSNSERRPTGSPLSAPETAPPPEPSPFRWFLADQSGAAWSDLHPVLSPVHEAAASEGAGDRYTELVAIGPEGGWTEAERQSALSSGATQVSFGPFILRVETAAVAAATLLQQ